MTGAVEVVLTDAFRALPWVTGPERVFTGVKAANVHANTHVAALMRDSLPVAFALMNIKGRWLHFHYMEVAKGARGEKLSGSLINVVFDHAATLATPDMPAALTIDGFTAEGERLIPAMERAIESHPTVEFDYILPRR